MDLSRGFVVEYRKCEFQRQVVRVLWGQTLALKMGWIKEVSAWTFRLGPNLLQEFHSDTIPTPDDVPDADSKPTVWKVDGGYLVLSVTCNWCFVQLNEKFRPSRNLPQCVPCTCIAMWKPVVW